MQVWRVLPLLFLSASASCQIVAPEQRVVSAFTVHGASKFAALAKIGALTHTTILIEVGDAKALQRPIDTQIPQSTVLNAVDLIFGRELQVTERSEGALLILSNAKERDRLLDLDLGTFTFTGGGYSSLEGVLSYSIRSASGCSPMGWAWAGPETMGTCRRCI